MRDFFEVTFKTIQVYVRVGLRYNNKAKIKDRRILYTKEAHTYVSLFGILAVLSISVF